MGALLSWNGFVFHVRGFEFVQNEVINTLGNNAKKWYIPGEIFILAKPRRERLKSALYLRLKKSKRLFLEKKLEIFEKKTWALLTYNLLQNIKRTRKGDSFETLKNFEKSLTMPKKNRKGGPVSLVPFCRLR